ncbi:MAG: hypothetical protein NT086_19665 [Proteobacteria bacterium]|nr:hypothetical protein [Pseudomonadota bacterium]
MKPSFKTTTSSDKKAALAAGDEIVEAARYKAAPDSKPWQLADPKGRMQEIVRLPAPVHAKLLYVYENAKGRPSKNQLITAAIEQYADQQIAIIDGAAGQR